MLIRALTVVLLLTLFHAPQALAQQPSGQPSGQPAQQPSGQPSEQPSGDEACVAARTEGIAHRDKGALLQARTAFKLCAAFECPPKLADECTALYVETNKAIASITVLAVTPDEQLTKQVRVLLGEQVLAEQLGDAPIELPPGEHTLRFELAGLPALEKPLVLKPGEKNQSVLVVFHAPKPAAPAPAPPKPAVVPSPAPPAPPAPVDNTGSLTLIGAGLGVAGAGLLMGVVAGSISLARRGDIAERCEQGVCTDEEIAKGELPAHVATAGFALAGAGAAVALGGWIWQLTTDESTEAAVTPVVGLGFAGVRGHF